MNSTNPTSFVDAQISAKTKILVVDDRPDGLLALEAVLTNEHYELVKASSGREAIYHAMYDDFAVILMDVQMPEMDGFETAKLIRENHRSKDTPIIFVTAISTENRHLYQGYKSGAVDYIFKPLDTFILKSKVDVFVDLFQKNQQIKQQSMLLRELEMQERERQLSELRQESQRQYINLADAVPHIIIKTDVNGKIVYFNQRWSEFTGFKSAEDWELITHPQDRRRFLVFWQRMQRENFRSFQTEVRLRSSHDGGFRWLLVRVVAEEHDGRITGWICTCTDIDMMKKAKDTFRKMSEDLNRSNKELEEFAYVASHDLKEPLHVVSSFICLLEKRSAAKLDDNEREYIRFIKQSIVQAQTLVRELLEFSRIGRERTMEMIDLMDVMKEVMANLKISIEDSGAVINYNGLPRMKSNHTEMVQLFQNIIDNAIKYRSQEPPEIHISCRSEYNKWIISIKDNGIGIDPQFHERIFEMFQRLHTRSSFAGAGVGLAVCKKIVENLGGKIWVESQIGKGSQFNIELNKQPWIS